MFKKIVMLLVLWSAAAGFAAVDVNKVGEAELDRIKGIGPVIAGKILAERKKGRFKDWNDFIARVKGVGNSNAARYSDQGLTVNGMAFQEASTSRNETKTKVARPLK